MDLLGGLSAFGLTERHLDRLRAIVASPLRPLELSLAGQALLVDGHEAEGIAAVEKAVAAWKGASPGAFQVRYLISRGRAPEAETLLRKAIAGHTDGPAPPRNWESHYTGLAEALAAQGRLAEARRVVTEHARLIRARGGKPPDAARQVEWNQRLGVAARSPAMVRAAAGESKPDARVEESLRAGTVHELAYAGDIAGAGSLAASLRRELGPGWRKRCTPIYEWDAAPKRCDALAALGEGRTEEAERDLRSVAEAAWLTDRFAAAFLLGELARARDDCSAAVRWMEQALAVKNDLGRLSFRAHVDPGMLQILAGCYEKLGEVQKARERNDRFLRLWANADPDIPLLADAKAMQARLAPIGSPSR